MVNDALWDDITHNKYTREALNTNATLEQDQWSDSQVGGVQLRVVVLVIAQVICWALVLL